jgi:hypothetical protein
LLLFGNSSLVLFVSFLIDFGFNLLDDRVSMCSLLCIAGAVAGFSRFQAIYFINIKICREMKFVGENNGF